MSALAGGARAALVAALLVNRQARAKSRLTDPIKIARECKSETELFCKNARTGRRRVMACLKGKIAGLSPACLAALRAAE
jgi:hypothetical protein